MIDGDEIGVDSFKAQALEGILKEKIECRLGAPSPKRKRFLENKNIRRPKHGWN